MNNIIERIKARIPSHKKRMIKISMDIVAQISEYMKSAGMNQKELADKLGKKESEISKWLNGSHNFTVKTIAKLEDIFAKDIILVPMFAEEDLGIVFKPKVAENLIFSIDYENAGSFNNLLSNDVPCLGIGLFMGFEKSRNIMELAGSNVVSYYNQN